MGSYLLRRIPSILLVLLLTSVIAFALPRLASGDPATTAAGSDASPAAVAAIRTQMGLDQPLPLQYLDWIGGVLTGDLGQSFSAHRSVAELIGTRLESTFELAAVAAVLMIAIGVLLGIAGARVHGGFWRAALDAVNAVLLAAPPFLTGLVLILAFGIAWPVLPASGEVSLSENFEIGIQYLLLPAVALALPQAAAISRLLESSMKATAREDFVDLAKAKGVPGGRIVRKHILRNSFGPALVTIGLRLGELLAGAIVVEAIFGRHGLGTLAITSVQNRDYLVIQALILGAVFIAVIMQLLTEIGVAFLDPRVRLGGAA